MTGHVTTHAATMAGRYRGKLSIPGHSQRHAALRVVVGGGTLAGLALSFGALVSASPICACGAAAAFLVLVFVAHVRDAVPMALFAAAGVAAVLYTQATQGAVLSATRYGTDALLLLGLPYLARLRFAARQQMAANKVLFWTGASMLAGILGGTTLRGGVLASWQDARWLGAVGVGVAIAGMLSPSQRIRWAFRWLLALNLLNMAVSGFQVYVHDYAATRLGLPEVTGLFGQTTTNALAATLLLIFVLVERRQSSRAELQLAVVVGLVDLLLSTRFKPGLAIVAVMVFIYLRRLGIRPIALALLGATIPVVVTLAFTWATAPGHIQAETEAVASALAHAEPRVQFMSGAQTLAARQFPLGDGSGTYGSNLDVRREREAFSEAGLAGQYGFGTQGPKFNSDNFVAHVLGERGYAGLAAWFVSLAALIYFALIASSSPFVPSVVIAAVALTPVVPVFRDGAAALLLFAPAALCLLAEPDSRQDNRLTVGASFQVTRLDQTAQGGSHGS
jgi:hypothetical protein